MRGAKVSNVSAQVQEFPLLITTLLILITANTHCVLVQPWAKHLTCIISFNNPWLLMVLVLLLEMVLLLFPFCWKKKKWGYKRLNNLPEVTSKQIWIQIQVSLTLWPILLTTIWYCLSALGLFLEKQRFQRREVRGSIIAVIHHVTLTLPSLLGGTCPPFPPSLVLTWPSPRLPLLHSLFLFLACFLSKLWMMGELENL